MQGLRRLLPRIAIGWLLFQLCIWTLTPTALCLSRERALAAVECTCPHESGQACPMHHPAQRLNTTPCSCRSTTNDAATVVSSLFGPTGVLAAPVSTSVVTAKSEGPLQLDSRPLDSHPDTDAPPPRA